MSLKIEEVIKSIQEVVKLDPKQLVAIETALEEKEAEKKADKAETQEPKSKKQFVVLLGASSKPIPDDLTAWVVQIPNSAAPQASLDRVNKAAHDFNRTKKGSKNRVNTIGETLENVPRKFFGDMLVKTKEPVYALSTHNKLGEAPSVE